ncbi:MAG: prepilin-type N-terminal cleavage/methylation domain-containing protein [Candidatus Komeilibacteria bacterium]|jgi:prepilin-type N-terminal cleavage/methylation domain-containing protein|nr:prepilin-type N-terminal cleavage/methylation domain-containing protein [Candidatus Komeilibacteria bacterium]
MKFKNLTLRLHSGQAGFTLIELIIVIAIIALLAAATFVAVNPAKRIGDANNAQRWSDITAIADAFVTYQADNTGTAATTNSSGTGTLDNDTFMIATSTYTTQANAYNTCAATTTDVMINLNALVTGGYIGKIGTDPEYTTTDDDDNTNYYLYNDASGAITVGACDTYEASGATNAVISVIR